ncbi:unnamed protein product [Ectocarpus sp. 12 AP-2014]
MRATTCEYFERQQDTSESPKTTTPSTKRRCIETNFSPKRHAYASTTPYHRRTRLTFQGRQAGRRSGVLFREARHSSCSFLRFMFKTRLLNLSLEMSFLHPHITRLRKQVRGPSLPSAARRTAVPRPISLSWCLFRLLCFPALQGVSFPQWEKQQENSRLRMRHNDHKLVFPLSGIVFLPSSLSGTSDITDQPQFLTQLNMFPCVSLDFSFENT